MAAPDEPSQRDPHFDAAVALSTWPRLYLDTADLLDIADGKSDAAVVEELRHTIAARRIIVVFTTEHLIDMAAKGLREAGRELGTLAERFPWRCVAAKEPTDIEPCEHAGSDITLQFAPNALELFTHPAASPVIGRFTALQDRAHAAGQAVQAIGGTKEPPLPKEAAKLYVQCSVTLIRGWLGNGIEDILNFWIQRDSLDLSAGALQRVRTRLRTFSAAWAELREQIDEDGRGALLQGMAASQDPARSPGTHLATCLAAARTRDGRRKPLRSDVVDSMHAFYFPYVDVATCDRFTHATLEKTLPTVGGSRLPRLIRTGSLPDVVAALRQRTVGTSETER
jgi:hypothetical protein